MNLLPQHLHIDLLYTLGPFQDFVFCITDLSVLLLVP